MSGDIAMVKSKLNEFSSFISGSKVDYRVVMMASRGSGSGTYDSCIPEPLGGPNGPRYRQVDQNVQSPTPWPS